MKVFLSAYCYQYVETAIRSCRRQDTGGFQTYTILVGLVVPNNTYSVEDVSGLNALHEVLNERYDPERTVMPPKSLFR